MHKPTGRCQQPLQGLLSHGSPLAAPSLLRKRKLNRAAAQGAESHGGAL